MLLPEPETPVTETSLASGIRTLIFFKLCSPAPFIIIYSPFPFLLFAGIGMLFSFDRYFPVIDFSHFNISLNLPLNTISPPWTPAPGPISTMKSDSLMVSSSCSITIIVLPRSLNLFKAFINFLLSLWCNPILGSSNIYKTPTKPEPIWVASLILWDSPPDNVPAILLIVK